MVLAMSTRPPVADPAVVDVDDEWGRVPGLRPPIPGWAPLAWFAVLAAVLTAVVVALVLPPGPLDDPDPAYQRDGLLIDGPVLPAGFVGVGFGEQRVVLVFDRMEPDPVELRRWASDVPPGVDVRLVLSETGAPGDAAGRVETVVDPPDGWPPRSTSRRRSTAAPASVMRWWTATAGSATPPWIPTT